MKFVFNRDGSAKLCIGHEQILVDREEMDEVLESCAVERSKRRVAKYLELCDDGEQYFEKSVADILSDERLLASVAKESLYTMELDCDEYMDSIVSNALRRK